jgi:peptidoglycan/LPS O-acetylase OafA/YrhL
MKKKQLLLLLTLLLSASFPVFAASDEVGVYILIFFVSIIGIAIFFLPTIIAFKRSHRNRWIIFLLNIFGATIILWIIALVWSLNKIDDPIKGGQPVVGQPGDRVL